MKKILVLGIKGMAGHVLYKKLKRNPKFSLFGIARNITETENCWNIDVKENVNILEQIIRNSNFDFIINCIGILNKDAEDHPAKAIWFNSFFPHYLEEITKNTNTKIIHISTDCVFNGKKGAYTENDQKDGFGFYAQSKALGELNNSKDLTIRTSIIGPEINPNGIGLFHWFMSQEKSTILKGFTNAFWSGITTIELANVIEYVIENSFSGLVQVAPKEKINKYSLLQLFNKIFRNNEMIILEENDYSVDKSLVSIRKDFKYNVPSYENMILDMKNWVNTENIYYY